MVRATLSNIHFLFRLTCESTAETGAGALQARKVLVSADEKSRRLFDSAKLDARYEQTHLSEAILGVRLVQSCHHSTCAGIRGRDIVKITFKGDVSWAAAAYRDFFFRNSGTSNSNPRSGTLMVSQLGLATDHTRSTATVRGYSVQEARSLVSRTDSILKNA